MYDLGEGIEQDVWRSILDDKQDSIVTIYVGFIAFTILLWDHMITFSDEIELIWQQPKTFMSWLFFLVRTISSLTRQCVHIQSNRIAISHPLVSS